MKNLILLCLMILAATAAERQTASMSGEVTNTTADIKAPAQIEIFREGGKITATLKTSPPLTGTGQLTGRCLDGWCDLSGKLDGGLVIKFRGVLNAHTFRGTYVVTPDHGPTQYGHFDFADVLPLQK